MEQLTKFIKLIKLHKVMDATGDGRSTHYNKIHKGLMVPPVRLGANSGAYPEHEIAAINVARVAGKTDDEIRQIVTDLIAARKNGAN
jgi:prophage regulatory protein